MSVAPSAPGREEAFARVRLPEPARLFQRRAARFSALAQRHAAPGWLLLLSRIAAGQAVAAREVRPTRPLLSTGPPLAGLERDGAWRRMLAVVVSGAQGKDLPAPARGALAFLGRCDEAELEAIADAVAGGATPTERLACAPFVAAALEVSLAALAAGLSTPPALDHAGACPACGGPPVAGVIEAEDRLRWLTCAACATEWNVPRLRCTACDTSEGPEYFHLEDDPSVKAEACPACRSYLKLFDLARRGGADASCDDAATLPLDLLLAEEGFHRASVNAYVGAGSPAPR